MQVGLWSRLLFREFDHEHLSWLQLGKERRLMGSLMSNGAEN